MSPEQNAVAASLNSDMVAKIDAAIGRQFIENMLVFCECFDVVYRPART